MSDPQSTDTQDELNRLAILFANRIGSPWGEGATYSHKLAIPDVGDEDEYKENGRLYSHLDDRDFELFVADLVTELQSLINSRSLKLLDRLKDKWLNGDQLLLDALQEERQRYE